MTQNVKSSHGTSPHALSDHVHFADTEKRLSCQVFMHLRIVANYLFWIGSLHGLRRVEENGAVEHGHGIEVIVCLDEFLG